MLFMNLENYNTRRFFLGGRHCLLLTGRQPLLVNANDVLYINVTHNAIRLILVASITKWKFLLDHYSP
jgi:hypothetical protein